MSVGLLSRVVGDTNERVSKTESVCIVEYASANVRVRDDVGGEEVEGEYSVMISMKSNE